MVRIGKEMKRKLAMLVAAVMIAAQLPATAMAAGPASQTAPAGAELSGLNQPPRLAANTTTGTEYPIEITKEGLTIKTSDAGNVEYAPGDGFKLKKNGAYEISGTWAGTLASRPNNQKAVINVTSGVEANITLNNLSIDASKNNNRDNYYACALAIEPGGEATIALLGESMLISGERRAGLEVPKRARVTINGGNTSKLIAQSRAGAGIGGSGGSGGAITINGGSVTAESDWGAGIGGGADGVIAGGSGGAITINGGSVTAKSSHGAGIGGGGGGGGGAAGSGIGGSGGAITINGGSVTAESSVGAGVGGGGSGNGGGSGGAIIINGGSVTAESSVGAGIGGGPGGIGDGGAITIKGGITTARSDRGAGIGGGSGIGGYDGNNGGAVTIEGGIVTAESSVGAGIGGGYGNKAGSGSDFTINGDAVVFAKSDKAADIGGGYGNIPGDDGIKNFNKGVVFEKNDGTVHGHPKLPCDVEIPAGYELTVPAGASLTIPDGITLNNKGTIINNGTLNIYGSITGNQPTGSGIINRASATEVSFAVKENGGYGNATAKFGDTIQITATARQRDVRTLNSRKAGLNKVAFYVGSTASEYNIGVVDNVTIEGGKAVARLEITLYGENLNEGFFAGVNTIIADFGGSSSLNLLDSIGTARLTINKISQPAPAAPELHSKTASSIKVNAISGQSYICTADSVEPIPGAGDWKNASNTELEFTGLEQGAEYYIWTYSPGSRYVADSEVSQPLMVTTLISEAEASVTAPAIGNAPASSALVPANADYEVSEVAWEPSDTSFQAGKAYTTRVTLAPKSNYSFADIASISGRLNGNNAVVEAGSAAGTITLSYQFEELKRRQGNSSSSTSAPTESYTAAGSSINQSVARTDLSLLASSGKSLSLSCDNASMRFSSEALRAILAAVPATADRVIFRAAPADLSGYPEAMEAIGSRPAYDFTISYRDINGNNVAIRIDFPAGSASVSLAYELAEKEAEESLFMAYVDENGNVSTVDGFSYMSGRLEADVPHFSIYGVGYQATEAEPDTAAELVFSDIADHWAKEDIEFVQARGLLSGTGGGLFSPDMDMTRGMFVTALGRLAGINSDEYSGRSFTDVAQGSYYAPYVEWAAQMNIVQGSGDGLFSPDAPITREQMAVIMTNYANQKGYAIPVVNSAASFADSGDISPWAVDGVSAMQRAGIINGRDGNRFDPLARATRAEVSAVLRRFVEGVVDSSAE